VTYRPPDGTVCVLRPPGTDPGEILRVARLVLPEVPYGELASQLGVPAGWPVKHRVPAKSACTVLAWIILTVIVAAGMTGSARPAQAGIRMASSTTQVTLAGTPGAAAPGPAARPAARYVVQPGDTLSGIAVRFAVRGGWPALYAANRPRIGRDPNVIRPGTVLVLPGPRPPARYRVVPGDTLAGIAAALAVPGGWPALYAANRPRIGPDPDVIRPGTVLTVPRAAASSPAAPRPAGRPVPPSAPAGIGHRPPPGRVGAPAAAGMPQWLRTVLLAAGLVTGAACLAGPVLAVRRRRRQAAARIARSGNAGVGIRCGRGGRSRGVAGAVRPVVAAARVHPAGVAVPGVVLVTGIVLFTFVEAAAMRVVPPPGGSGPGSVSAVRPGPGRPHHRLQPRQPGQPALPGGSGRNARRLACGLEQVAAPLPVLAAVPPAGPGRVPRVSRDPSSRLPGGGLACDAGRVPSSAAPAAAGSGGADQ
jgi:LysM repeat protein